LILSGRHYYVVPPIKTVPPKQLLLPTLPTRTIVFTPKANAAATGAAVINKNGKINELINEALC
jgi:hypothetical protein